MNKTCTTLILAIFAITGSALHATGAELPKTVPENSEYLLEGIESTYVRSGKEFESLAQMEVIDVEDMHFSKATRVRVSGSPSASYTVGVRYKVPSAVYKGDEMFLRLWVRSPESVTGKGTLIVNHVMTMPPWKRILSSEHSVGADWTCIDLPYVADIGLAKSRIAINLGFPDQTIDVGRLDLVRISSAKESVGPAPVKVPSGRTVGDAAGNELPKEVPQKSEFLLEGIVSDYLRSGDEFGSLAEMEVIDVEGMHFSKATRVHIPRAPSASYSVGVRHKVPSAVHKGDRLFLRLWVRSPESVTGQGTLIVNHVMTGPPWKKLLSFQHSVGEDWESIDLPYIAGRDLPTSQININLGFRNQTLDIGRLDLIRLPAGSSIDDLPKTEITYAGREADAEWRSAALDRIEQIRKGTIEVQVHNSSGQPVPGATVEISQVEELFHWGTAIQSGWMMKQTPGADRYRELILEHFNEASPGNILKWNALEDWGPDFSLERADVVLDWIRENDLTVRGHTLIWPGWKNLPKRLRTLQNDPVKLQNAVDERILDMTQRFKGKIDDWDVINEPFNNHDLIDILGEEMIDRAFRLAREGDPDAALYLNDFGQLASNNQLNSAHQEYIYGLMNRLVERDVPVDGIGFQCHFSSQPTDPEKLLQILDRFADLGLKIKITELDMLMADEDLRADYMRDFHIAVFSHPAVAGIQHWGFWHHAHWRPESALFDQHFNLRKHGKEFFDLRNQWRTQTSVETNDNGQAQVKAFLGTYRITVTHGGSQIEANLELLHPGKTETVTLVL